MIFYHGSKYKIDTPKEKGSNPHNDYGPSFYTTMNLDDAKQWACKNNEIGLVNKYSIRKSEFKSLKILDLTDKTKYSVLNWLAILMHFRELDPSFERTFKNRLVWLEKYYINIDEYDVVKGFRADDACFKFPLKFISGLLSFENLTEVYMLGNLGVQYAFTSKRAIKKLHFVICKQCGEHFIGKYYQVIKDGTSSFEEILNEPIDDTKTYIMDLIKDYE